jgi:phage gpG-like protein
MTSVRVEIDPASLDRLETGLGELIRLAQNPQRALEATGELIAANTVKRFDTGRGPGGIPWIPSGRVQHEARPGGFNKDGSRGKSKKALNKIGPNDGGKTLVQSGSLRESITSVVVGDEVHVGVQSPAPGNAHEYAAVHQFGATIEAKDGGMLAFEVGGIPVFAKSVTIPARPFLGIDQKDVDDVGRLWTRLVTDAINGGSA